MFSLLKFKEAARTVSDSTSVPRTAIPEGTTLEQLRSELLAVVEVPDDKGHVTPKPFSQCSVEEMRRALRRKRMPASSKPLPPEVEARAEQRAEAVAQRFPHGKGTRVKVALRNEKGKAVMDFKGIPEDQLELLAEALLAKPPSAPLAP